MYGIYQNRTTPFLAFLEGMVRAFDWGALLELRKSQAKRESEDEAREDKEWRNRIVDWYIRDSIGAFEAEESRKLVVEPMLHRRAFAVADILLGPVPTQKAILRYEELVPGACDRIMERATQRLENDGETEIELLKERAKQGYMGMAAGFILGLRFTGMALFLVYTDRSWPGLSLIGVYIGIALAVSIYISKAQLRRKFYTRDFFSSFLSRKNSRKRSR